MISREELSGPVAEAQAWEWCARARAGEILYFPETPVPIAADDLAFLLGQQQTDSSLHKNIAYKPARGSNPDKLSGVVYGRRPMRWRWRVCRGSCGRIHSMWSNF